MVTDANCIKLLNSEDINMVTNVEKEKILDDIIQNATDYESVDYSQQKLRKLLLDDTLDGKLFKYRTCSERSFELIKNQRLYCADPSSFNDPFDCKIGVDFQSALKDLYEPEMSFIQAICNHFVLVAKGEIQIQDCPIEEQNAIRLLLINHAFHDLQSKSFNSEQEASAYIKQHPEILIDLLKPLLESSEIGNKIPLIHNMVNNVIHSVPESALRSLENGSQSITDFIQLNGINDDFDQIDLIKKWAKKQSDETLYESALEMEKQLLSVESYFQKKINGSFRVASLAADNKNRLMWAHYATDHTGFCIEYDYKKASMLNLPAPVIYSTNRIKVPWAVMQNNSTENIRKATQCYMKALLVKDEAWAYEQEWRIIIPSMGVNFVNMPPISCIYLGARCSEENAAIIKQISYSCGIPVKKMMLDRGEYALHIEEMSDAK